MFVKHKFKKICKKCKGPDYTDRIPALEDLENVRKTQIALYKKAALCVCMVIALIAATFAGAFFGMNINNPDSSNVLNNSSQSSAENIESKEDAILDSKEESIKGDAILDSKEETIVDNKDRIIYAEKTDYMVGDANILNIGTVELTYRLQDALETPENENCIFAVYLELHHAYDAVNVKGEKYAEKWEITKKRKALIFSISYYADNFYEIGKRIMNNECGTEKLIQLAKDDARGVDASDNEWQYAWIQYEELGGFDKNIFDSETIDAMHRIIFASEEQLQDRSFIETALIDLEDICKFSGVTIKNPCAVTKEPSVIYYKAMEAAYYEELWIIDEIIDSLKSFGVDAYALEVEEYVVLGLTVPVKTYKAYLTKEQIEEIKDTVATKYGVKLCMQTRYVYS